VAVNHPVGVIKSVRGAKNGSQFFFKKEFGSHFYFVNVTMTGNNLSCRERKI
jgi:hypothetical protein